MRSHSLGGLVIWACLLSACASSEPAVTPTVQPVTAMAPVTQPIAPVPRRNDPGQVWGPPPEWEYVIEGEDSVYFIHRASLVQTNDTIEAWFLENLFAPIQDLDGNIYSSEKAFYQIDCPRRSYRLVDVIKYAALNGSGSVAYSGHMDHRPIRSAAPGSVAEGLVTAACRQ